MATPGYCAMLHWLFCHAALVIWSVAEPGNCGVWLAFPSTILSDHYANSLTTFLLDGTAHALSSGWHGQAVQLAESISGAKHPRLVPLLTLLGTVFARTARVTVAEGIFRWALQHVWGLCSICAGPGMHRELRDALPAALYMIH